MRRWACSFTFAMLRTESDPVCEHSASSQGNTVTEYDLLTMTCSVNFSGNWAPSIHCRPGANNSRTSVTRGTVVYRQQLPVTADLNAASVSCATDFVETNRRRVEIAHSTVASNAPSYVYTWTSSPINVLCRPIRHYV